MFDFFINLLSPIMWGEAWIMVGWHKLFTLVGLPEAAGITWALAIAGLTAVVRALLIPLFVKQIHSSRRMQLIQPEVQKIQAKYKGKTDPDSRQAMTQETMDLYKRTGTNPFSSCLPILIQSPFFFALFQVLNNLQHIAQGTHAPVGPITVDVARTIEASTLFGAQLSSTFVGSSDIQVKILTAVLIVLMSATTFTTQRQLMTQNMPDSALNNPFMKQQKIILYLMPLFFAVSGINFPIGVLVYWLITNLWSMGQQLFVIRRMPAPGSAAERALHARQARRGKTVEKLSVPGLSGAEDAEDGDGAGPISGQRQQPKGKKRAKKAGPSAANSTTDGGSSGSADAPAKAPTDATTPSDGPTPASSTGGGSAGGASKKRKRPKPTADPRGDGTEGSPGSGRTDGPHPA